VRATCEDVIDRATWGSLLAEAAAEGAGQPRRICLLCTEALGVNGAGISMVTPTGNRGVVCATDEVSALVEQLQFTLGEGPCVDAVSTGAPVLIGDLADRTGFALERWPAFLEATDAVGVRALFAFPLRVGAVRLGAMDMYRTTPGELPAAELSAALLAADAAALSLLHLDGDGSDFLAALHGGAAYQLQVHQATGMVMAQLGVSVEVALLRLRARAFASGRSVQDLAQDVIDRRTRFSPEDL
jgi:hypothetical protein